MIYIHTLTLIWMIVFAVTLPTLDLTWQIKTKSKPFVSLLDQIDNLNNGEIK